MEHLSEEQLILHYYGESEAASAAGHLAVCEQCREEYQRLQLVLNSVDSAPVPVRDANYSAQIWERISPRVGRSKWWISGFQRWVAAAAIASMLVVAFYAGRYTSPPAQPASLASGAVRERILMVAVGDHLERSQLVLAELVNSDTSRSVDISSERELAESLLGENRLYRQTASANGETNMANVLDDLERVLLEIAHSPEKATGEQVDQIRSRIESQGLLFRVRVIESQLRQQEVQPLAAPETKL